MIPTSFAYKRASSVAEAISLLSAGEDAKLLAGGHSLLPSMKLRLNEAGTLIDIGQLNELRYIDASGGMLRIGAGSTHHEIASSEVVGAHVPLLAQVGATIGDVQVRNKGTIGGSIAHADPAADWPAGLLATDAVIVAQGPNGPREYKAAGFFQGLFTTALGEHEIITEIRVPLPPQGTRVAYAKFAQPASRFALVGCAVAIAQSGGNISHARVAFTGVSGAAFRDQAVEQALMGQPANADTFAAAAARAASEQGHVMSDHFASEDYRRHLARVFAKRALMAAAAEG